MDPDVTLAELKALVAQHDIKPLRRDDVDRFCALFEGLNAWLANGGFLPRTWANGRES